MPAFSPFVVCLGTSYFIWTLFDRVEDKRVAKPIFDRKISALLEAPASLLSILSVLPTYFLFIFDAVFTDRLYSFKGFFRSAQISVVVVALLSVLWYSTKPPDIQLWIGPSPRGDFYPGYACPLQCPAINALVPNLKGDGRSWVTAHFIFPNLLAPLLYNFLAD
jgi:hypothetical protein